MKRLITITLLLCLIAACVPAMADRPVPRGEARATASVPFTMDLSSGVAEFQEYTETFNSLLGIFDYMWMQPGFDLTNEYRDRYDYPYSDVDPLLCYFDDLDYDGTPDIVEMYTDPDIHPQIMRIVVSPWCSIKTDSFDFYCPGMTNAPYSPLTFMFRKVVAVGTGRYKVGGGEAEYLKPAKKNAASVKIPAGITVNGKAYPVTKIADNAFKNNKKLTKVTIGPNIKEIGKNAFANCAKLKTVSGGANVEIIGDSAFSGCKALKGFTIGAKVTRIGKKAFYKCSALRKITIKTRLLTAKTVGSSAFKGIYPAATIKVPKAVKKDYTKWLLKKGVKKTMKIK